MVNDVRASRRVSNSMPWKCECGGEIERAEKKEMLMTTTKLQFSGQKACDCACASSYKIYFISEQNDSDGRKKNKRKYSTK